MSDLLIDATKIIAYSINEARIAELKQEFSLLTVESAQTTKGYQEVMKALATCRDARNNLEDQRKDFKKPFLEAERAIDAEAKRLDAEITALEAPVKAIRKTVDDAKAKEKAEKEAAERKRVEDELKAKLAKEAAEKSAEAARVKAEQDKIEEQQRAQKAALDKQREEQEEKQRLLDAREAEIAAAAKKIEDDRAAAEAIKKADLEAMDEVAQEFLEGLEKEPAPWVATDEDAEAIKAAPEVKAALEARPSIYIKDWPTLDQSNARIYRDKLKATQSDMPRLNTDGGIALMREVDKYLQSAIAAIDDFDFLCDASKSTDPTLAAIAKSVKSEMGEEPVKSII